MSLASGTVPPWLFVHSFSCAVLFLSRQQSGFVGLKNGGATCYMNAVFQQLFMQPSIRALVLGAKEAPPEDRKDSVFFHLQVCPGLAVCERMITSAGQRLCLSHSGNILSLRPVLHATGLLSIPMIRIQHNCHVDTLLCNSCNAEYIWPPSTEPQALLCAARLLDVLQGL